MSENSKSCAAVILAAGKGTRMRSATPKVLHQVAHLSLVGHVMQVAENANCNEVVVVTSPDMPEVAAHVKKLKPDTMIAEQAEQLGTGHAVQAAQACLQSKNLDQIIVLCGDSPLIQPDTIRKMQARLQNEPELAVVVMGFYSDNPPAYGRLIRDEHGYLERIVEAKDASDEELSIGWCNAGVMAIRADLIWPFLSELSNDNTQGEYYLTDIIAIARAHGYQCAIEPCQYEEALGVNTRAQLAEVEQLMQQRLRAQAMAGGVTMIAPESVHLAYDTQFGQDVLIEPHVFFGAKVSVADNVHIKAFSHIEGATIAQRATVGPFARLRPGSEIGEECKIGNFVEIKNANVARDAKISHLSYIGDATIGENVNIGAGTITCNYDGYDKYHTIIEKDVFIGSNSALVAPVTIGQGAIVGAGSVITDDVSPDALALARSRQTEKAGRAAAFKAEKKDSKQG